MLFVWRPYSLSGEAVGWMREQAAPLAATGASAWHFVRLGAPGVYGDSDCEWLIEMYGRVEDAAAAARTGPCRDLLADLRLLGMPQLVVADSSEPVES